MTRRHPHPNYSTVYARIRAIQEGERVPDARHGMGVRAIHLATLADVLAETSTSDWVRTLIQDPLMHLNPNGSLDPSYTRRLATAYYYQNEGYWPDLFTHSGKKARRAAERAICEGTGWAARLQLATWPTASITLDVDDLDIGLDNAPHHYWSHAACYHISWRFRDLIPSAYWYRLEISDSLKLHVHALCAPEEVPLRARIGASLHTTQDMELQLEYLLKSPVPIPGQRRRNLPPQTHHDIRRALEMVGAHLAYAEIRQLKGVHTYRPRTAGSGPNLPSITEGNAIYQTRRELEDQHQAMLARAGHELLN